MRDPVTNPELNIPAAFDRNKKPTADHAVLSPSSAHRWMVCPGSVRLSARCENVDSEYAQEGTDAHSLAAHCLVDGSDAWEHINTEFSRGAGRDGKDKGKFLVSKDMADAVQLYLDYTREKIISRGPNNYRIETRFDLSEIVPQNWGTSDLCGYDEKEQLLDVLDYKHGIGVSVEAEDNEQLMNYGAGVVHELSALWPDIKRVRLHIVQPRGFHEAGPIRVWETTVEALGAWVTQKLKPAGELALTDDAAVGPIGDHCQFCPAKLICPAQRAVFDTVSKAAETTGQAEVAAMEDYELASARAQAAGIRKYLAALDDEAFRRMMKGSKVPGVKLVAKKSDRVWKPEAEALAKAKWGDDAYSQPTLLSPAKLEKLRGGKEFAAEHAFKPDTGLTLADEDDKRPAVTVRTAAEVFANVKA